MPVENKIHLRNGQSIDLSLNPYDYGSDAYYTWIRDRELAAEGRTLTRQADVNGQPATYKIGGVDYGTDFNAAKAAFDAAELQRVRNEDRHGKMPTAYQELQDASGQKYYRPIDKAFTGQGKAGGAGNTLAGAASVDNSWNLADGVDVRTDQQKFYDRNLTGFNEVADENGKYSWYATETGYDPTNPQKTRQLNLDELGTRTDASQSAKDSGYFRDPTDKWSGQNYWDYNNGPSKSYFDDQIRNRANKSPYARSGMGAYY